MHNIKVTVTATVDGKVFTETAQVTTDADEDRVAASTANAVARSVGDKVIEDFLNRKRAAREAEWSR